MTVSISPERLFGIVSAVDGITVSSTAPFAALPESSFIGESNPRGRVGEFLVLESRGGAILGRLLSVELAQPEMRAGSWRAGSDVSTRPQATIELQGSIDELGRIYPGIQCMPRIGDRIYTAGPQLLMAGLSSHDGVHLGSLSQDPEVRVACEPKELLGRHLGILGATGGGKSWTLAHIAEEVARLNGRMLLLDATGEYSTLTSSVRHLEVGANGVTLPIHELSDTDRVIFFRPSTGAQLPKMREAIYSLRLAKHLGASHTIVHGGLIRKCDKPRSSIISEMRTHADVVNDMHSPFDMTLLAQQINEECVWPNVNQYGTPGNFGGWNQQEISYVSSLVTRVEEVLHRSELVDFLAPPSAGASLIQEIDVWIDSGTESILRLDLSQLPQMNYLPEVTVNTIGNHLLTLARGGKFSVSPLVVALDEAHRFLGRNLGDDNMLFKAEAFEFVAKEARKYGLNLIVATQRPGDIPSGVLSQIGTLIVHRLTERRDQDHIADASSVLDRRSAHMLPSLVPGEALLVGGAVPLAVPVRVARPQSPPDSGGSTYDSWRAS